jgi:hypothetical protein
MNITEHFESVVTKWYHEANQEIDGLDVKLYEELARLSTLDLKLQLMDVYYDFCEEIREVKPKIEVEQEESNDEGNLPMQLVLLTPELAGLLGVEEGSSAFDIFIEANFLLSMDFSDSPKAVFDEIGKLFSISYSMANHHRYPTYLEVCDRFSVYVPKTLRGNFWISFPQLSDQLVAELSIVQEKYIEVEEPMLNLYHSRDLSPPDLESFQMNFSIENQGAYSVFRSERLRHLKKHLKGACVDHTNPFYADDIFHWILDFRRFRLSFAQEEWHDLEWFFTDWAGLGILEKYRILTKIKKGNSFRQDSWALLRILSDPSFGVLRVNLM